MYSEWTMAGSPRIFCMESWCRESARQADRICATKKSAWGIRRNAWELTPIPGKPTDHRANSVEADSAEELLPVRRVTCPTERNKETENECQKPGRQTSIRLHLYLVWETVTAAWSAWPVTPDAVREPQLPPGGRIHSLMRLTDTYSKSNHQCCHVEVRKMPIYTGQKNDETTTITKVEHEFPF